MEALLPWDKLLAVSEPFYPKGQRGLIKTMAAGAERETLKATEKVKAAVRAFVEHPFHILKNLFGHRKVRDRGLAKNGHQLYTLLVLANMVIGGRAATTQKPLGQPVAETEKSANFCSQT